MKGTFVKSVAHENCCIRLSKQRKKAKTLQIGRKPVCVGNLFHSSYVCISLANGTRVKSPSSHVRSGISSLLFLLFASIGMSLTTNISIRQIKLKFNLKLHLKFYKNSGNLKICEKAFFRNFRNDTFPKVVLTF